MIGGWKHRTNVGRVVYDRKPNLFKCKDVLRIIDKISYFVPKDDFERDHACYRSVADILFRNLRLGVQNDDQLDSLIEMYQTHIDALEEVREDPQRGGQFGGAGASREEL